jgi:hypothetical protein
MALREKKAFQLVAAKVESELLPAFARPELRRRKLTQELGEVLIEYHKLELEIHRRRIVVP